jgi:hypothetical protein
VGGDGVILTSAKAFGKLGIKEGRVREIHLCHLIWIIIKLIF